MAGRGAAGAGDRQSAPTRSPPTPAARKFDVYADTRSQVYRGAAAETAADERRASPRRPGRSSPTRARPRSPTSSPTRGGTPKTCRTPSPAPNRSRGWRASSDPYDTGPRHSWKLSLSFATAAARLRGLVKGSLPRDRGAEARLLPADPHRGVLGTAGNTRISRRRTGGAAGAAETPGPTSALARRAARQTRARPQRTARAGAGAGRAQSPSPSPPDPGGGAAGTRGHSRSPLAGGRARRCRVAAAVDASSRLCPARPMPAPLLIADVPWLLYRALLRLPKSILGSDGRPVNALLGTVNALLAVIEARPARAVAACFGAEQAAYRVELYPPYHAHREPMPAGARRAVGRRPPACSRAWDGRLRRGRAGGRRRDVLPRAHRDARREARRCC